MPAPPNFLEDLAPLQHALETMGFRFALGLSPKSPLDTVAHFEKPGLFVWIVQEADELVAYADRKSDPTIVVGRFRTISDAHGPVIGWATNHGDV